MSLAHLLSRLCALCATAAVALAQVPLNDECASAGLATVGATAFDITFATSGTGLPLDPNVCDMGPFGDEQIYDDVWFTFTPSISGGHSITAANSTGDALDSRLALYDQGTCPDDPANVIGCDDNSGVNFNAQIQDVPLTANQSYLIRLGGPPANLLTGGDLMFICVTEPSAPISNDLCSAPTPVGLGFNNFFASGAAGQDGAPLDPAVCDMGPFGDEQIYGDIWFAFTPTATRNYDFQLLSYAIGYEYDSRIAIYTPASCPDDPSDVIACADLPGHALVSDVLLVGGNTYLIRVGKSNPQVRLEAASLLIKASLAPLLNNACADATPITNFGTYAFDNAPATTDGGNLAGFCDFGSGSSDQIHDDVWFAFTPSVSGCTYISTWGLAGFNTRIAVYDSASCPDDPATVLACSDDEVQPAVFPFEAGLDVTLTAGSSYLIRVGNPTPSASGGAGGIHIGPGPAAILNDGGAQPGAPGCLPAQSFPNHCNGDGGDQMGCTNCPCANNSPVGTLGGCRNSAGLSARITASGDPSVSLPAGSSTDLRIRANGIPAGALCVLFSGSGLGPVGMANPCFGLGSGTQALQFDGLRCATSDLHRHGARSADSLGTVGSTNAGWGGPSAPPGGLAAQAGFVAGQTRYFQLIHRDLPGSVCPVGRGLNTSQAVEVLFQP